MLRAEGMNLTEARVICSKLSDLDGPILIEELLNLYCESWADKATESARLDIQRDLTKTGVKWLEVQGRVLWRIAQCMLMSVSLNWNVMNDRYDVWFSGYFFKASFEGQCGSYSL